MVLGHEGVALAELAVGGISHGSRQTMAAVLLVAITANITYKASAGAERRDVVVSSLCCPCPRTAANRRRLLLLVSFVAVTSAIMAARRIGLIWRAAGPA
jgi:hypothetical protein